MKVIPAIDIIGGKTVRLKQGKYDQQLDYEVTPEEAAKKWEQIGAEMIHVVDLDGAKEGRPVNLSVVADIARAVSIPIEVGGGFRNESDIEKALAEGVARVIVGSRALEDFDFAKRCIEKFGDKLILSVDAEECKIKARGWEEALSLDLFDTLRKIISFGAKEIIYTDIKSDGMLSGPNTNMLGWILSEVDIKIISAGGIKTVKHIKELKKLESKGLSGVILGRALYEGTIDLREAIDAGKADSSVS